MKKILVTGATGFVGKALTAQLLYSEVEEVRAAVRVSDKATYLESGCMSMPVGDIGPQTNWKSALLDVDAVIHLAARVHVMLDRESNPFSLYRRVNTEGTVNLARQAAEAGVRRFIYLSSIKVNGEQTRPGKPFTEWDMPAPLDFYAVSKYEAEEGLMELAKQTSMEIVIIRPPLVYGPDVKGNFFTMMRWLQKGVPLPLGAIHNRRSLVALDNLVDLIITCLEQTVAANQVFLAGDGEDLSTTELMQRLGEALNRPARLVPVPPWLLTKASIVFGKRAIAERLCGSLQVDIAKAKSILGWSPPVSVDKALKRTSIAYLSGLA